MKCRSGEVQSGGRAFYLQCGSRDRTITIYYTSLFNQNNGEEKLNSLETNLFCLGRYPYSEFVHPRLDRYIF